MMLANLWSINIFSGYHWPFVSLWVFLYIEVFLHMKPIKFFFLMLLILLLESPYPPCGSASKESTCNAGDLDSIPGLGRSPGEGKGYPLQYSSLENSMDSPRGRKELDTTERLSPTLFTHPKITKYSCVFIFWLNTLIHLVF